MLASMDKTWYRDLPMNALGMVIFSHILSLISKPESGAAIARTIVSIGVFTVNFISSYGPKT